jgi:uncharacterized membrane protein YcaP (DUF421 family)
MNLDVIAHFVPKQRRLNCTRIVMDVQELLMTAVRSAGVYVLMLTVIRLTGKAFDLLVALMLGEVVDEMIYGDVSFLQGSVAIVVVAGMKSMTAWLSYSNQKMEKVLEGEPVLVVKNGEFQSDGLRKERLNELDVLSELRLQNRRHERGSPGLR